MPKVCDYVVIHDQSFELSNPGTVYQTFTRALKGVTTSGDRAILIWVEKDRSTPSSVSYDVSINGTTIGSFSVKTNDSHSVHEVFDENLLKNGDNLVTFTVTSSGTVKFHDAALLYQREV